MLEKTGPVSYKIKNHLTNTVTDVNKWDIPSPNRRIRKTTLVTQVSSDSSNTETDEEDSDDGFIRKRYGCVRENSDNESDTPVMQHQLELNDEEDMETCDRDAESSGCKQSRVGDSVAGVREIVRKQPKGTHWVGEIGLPKINDEVRPEFNWPLVGSVETDSDCKDCCRIC